MQILSRNKSKSIQSEIIKQRDIHSALNILYKVLLLISSISVIILLLFILDILWVNSQLIISKYGISNLFQDKWETTNNKFGLIPLLQGTLVTSIYSLIISIPLSIGISLYISHYISDHRIKDILKYLIELIAAIPSVLIGLWGIAVLGPGLRNFDFYFDFPLIPKFVFKLSLPFIPPLYFSNPINLKISVTSILASLPKIPLLNFPIFPYLEKPAIQGGLSLNVFTATIALVIMITPIIVSVSVSIMNQVPDLQKEAALALGATEWEMSKMTIIPQSLRGVVGAISLGFGRALGETMAVTMLIGNSNHVFGSIFNVGTSFTATIANEWGIDIGTPLSFSALLEIGLVLMIISLIVNLLARALVKGTVSTGTGRMEF